MGSQRVKHDWVTSLSLFYSACELNKQGDNTQPWRTPFPIWNQSIVPCPVLTVASWPTYRFLRRQKRWSGIPISFRIFHSLLWSTKNFGIVNKAVDVFLKLSCFFHDPADVGNLVSGSSAFYKSSLNIWKFSIHGLLKPSMENFEDYFASIWNECNCAVVWMLFGIALWDWNENWPFPVLWPLLFSKFARILIAALSQYQLLGFEIAQLEFHHFY